MAGGLPLRPLRGWRGVFSAVEATDIVAMQSATHPVPVVDGLSAHVPGGDGRLRSDTKCLE
jgi:hypothetical protein